MGQPGRGPQGRTPAGWGDPSLGLWWPARGNGPGPAQRDSPGQCQGGPWGRPLLTPPVYSSAGPPPMARADSDSQACLRVGTASFMRIPPSETTGSRPPRSTPPARTLTSASYPDPVSEVRIYVKAADPGRVVQPARVVLQEGTAFWGPTSGSMESPLQAGAPYVAKGVQPGTHTAMVYLSNRLMVRKQITVQAGERDLDVTIQIPIRHGRHWQGTYEATDSRPSS